MNKLYFYTIGLIVMIGFLTGCCSWNYEKKDFEFTEKELNPLQFYKVGDTIYFESNLGNIDTITVVETTEERQEGNKCFISTPPYHIKTILIKHLPSRKNKWPGATWIKEDGKEITLQSLILISKYPLDSTRTGYGISFKNFTTLDNALSTTPRKFIIDGNIISNCYKVKHGYPERVINPNDIEVVYWTAKYGLTAYTSKAGETWFVKSLE